MKLELIRAQEKDMDYLLKLRKDTMSFHLKNMGLEFTDEKHLLSIRRDFDCAYLLEIDEKIVGLMKFEETDQFLNIKQFQIDHLEQGKGIGQFVLEYFVKKAEEGDKFLKLKVLKKNPAKGLYERMGFQIYDEDKYEYFMQRKP